MSSSRRKEPLMDDALPCPACGKVDIAGVTETVVLEDGVVARNLPHSKCRSCAFRLFDTKAVHTVQKTRNQAKRSHKKAA